MEKVQGCFYFRVSGDQEEGRLAANVKWEIMTGAAEQWHLPVYGKNGYIGSVCPQVKAVSVEGVRPSEARADNY